MIGDPFLNYFALFLLFFVVVVIFYAIIAIRDIPHLIAKGRDHPHQDALWSFRWIWAMAYVALFADDLVMAFDPDLSRARPKLVFSIGGAV